MTTESFPCLVDALLGDLEEFSQIRIDCINDKKYDSSYGIAPVRVTAVNGTVSSSQFLNLLRHFKAVTLGQFRRAVANISPEELDPFIDLSLRRVRRLIRSVIMTEPWKKGSGTALELLWHPYVIQCFVEDVETDDPRVYAEAMLQAGRQAWLYYVELKQIEERINCLAGAVVILPAPAAAEVKLIPAAKVRLNCSVAFLGAMLRVACDRNLIECDNVAELCRVISRNFNTARQSDLSPRSIRNHYDNPMPQALEEVTRELHVWERYIPKLLNQP